MAKRGQETAEWTKNRKKDKNELRKGKKRLKRGKCSKGWTKKQKKQAREAAKGEKELKNGSKR